MSILPQLAEFTSRVLPQPVKRVFYRIPILSELIRKQLNLSVPSGLSYVTVAAGVLRGARLKLNLKSEKYYWLGTYEPHLIRTIFDFCKPGMVVYDIGANIGYVSLALARIVGMNGQVYAFEALPENVQRMTEHVSLNSLQSVIHLVPYAVSDCEGREVFLVHLSHAMGKLAGSSGREAIYVDKLEVKSVRLDDFVYRDGNPPPDLIKMDIEGGGVKAIPGMLRILKEHRPICFMELHGAEEQTVAWSALEHSGYSICYMRKGYPKVGSLNAVAFKEHIVALP